MANLASSLEQQTVITHIYLSGLEQNNGYQIYLWDQDMPFRFNEVPHHTLSLQTRELLLSYLPGEDAKQPIAIKAGLSLPEKHARSCHREKTG